MATFVPANIDIPWHGIENGAVMNDDGHGWAVASKHGLEVGKSMSYDLAALTLASAREAHGPDSLVLFHSRFATHGETNEFNVHPFPVGEGGDTVMVHNGILPSKWHPLKGDPRSDTRVFADTTGSIYSPNGVPSRRGGKAMGSAIGSGNKLVFLTAKDGKPKVRIVNAHLGTFTEGVWYSNSGYLPYTGYAAAGLGTGWDYDYTSSKGQVARFDPEDDGCCPWCGSLATVDVASSTCTACEVCLDCHEWMGDCMCYFTPAEREGAQAREEAQVRGKQDVQLWTPNSSPLNPRFEPASVGIEV